MKSEIGIEKQSIAFLIGDILNMPRFKVGFEKIQCETNDEIAKVLKLNEFLSEITNIPSPERKPKKVIEILKKFYSSEDDVLTVTSVLGYSIEDLQSMIKYYKENCYDNLITERIDKDKVREAIEKWCDPSVEFKCPNCKNELQYSLKKQVLGNNCNCGFPDKSQRTLLYRFKIWLKFLWRI